MTVVYNGTATIEAWRWNRKQRKRVLWNVKQYPARITPKRIVADGMRFDRATGLQIDRGFMSAFSYKIVDHKVDVKS
jgi:hypothetical protein